MAKTTKIPRQFRCIEGRILVETSLSKPGDTLCVSKIDHSTGYLACNTRTGKEECIFLSMLRNPNVFELVEVWK